MNLQVVWMLTGEKIISWLYLIRRINVGYIAFELQVKGKT